MVDRNYIPPRPIFEARKRMNDAIRRFFDGRGFLEVETPIAVVSPGLEPHLEPFITTEIGPDRSEKPLFLHTSPEYAMKRILGQGLGSIYQLARVFRNGERSDTHAPEFTMLEWYRQPGDLEAVVEDTVGLIRSVAASVGGWFPSGVTQLSVSEAFIRVGLGDPLDYLEDVEGLCREMGVPVIPGDDWSSVFFRAFFEHVEGAFDPDEITILHGYPASMAALARISRSDPRQAERFEVFLGRLELGNAFGELADPDEQRRRFECDLAERRSNAMVCPPIDEALLKALPAMGDAAGIAVGIDRLLMKCLGLKAVQDVICLSPRDG